MSRFACTFDFMKALLPFVFVVVLGTQVLFGLDLRSLMEPGDTTEVVLTIPSDEVRIEGAFAVFSPDSGVMKSWYEHIWFSRDNHAAYAGASKPGSPPLKVRVLLVRMNNQTRIPDAPNLPAPQGGFTDYRYLGIILSREP